MSIKDTVKDCIQFVIACSLGLLSLFLSLFLLAYVLVWVDAVVDTPAVADNKPAAAAEDSPAIECGSCGAHVCEYWYVENINNGTPVEVCRYCYENYVANTATEN